MGWCWKCLWPMALHREWSIQPQKLLSYMSRSILLILLLALGISQQSPCLTILPIVKFHFGVVFLNEQEHKMQDFVPD